MAMRVHDALKQKVVLSLPAGRRFTQLAYGTVASAMEVLVDCGVAREITGNSRNRLFICEKYISILNEGTEMP